MLRLLHLLAARRARHREAGAADRRCSSRPRPQGRTGRQPAAGQAGSRRSERRAASRPSPSCRTPRRFPTCSAASPRWRARPAWRSSSSARSRRSTRSSTPRCRSRSWCAARIGRSSPSSSASPISPASSTSVTSASRRRTLIESDPIRLQTSCAATTFRFLDEAERERHRQGAREAEGGEEVKPLAIGIGVVLRRASACAVRAGGRAPTPASSAPSKCRAAERRRGRRGEVRGRRRSSAPGRAPRREAAPDRRCGARRGRRPVPDKRPRSVPAVHPRSATETYETELAHAAAALRAAAAAPRRRRARPQAPRAMLQDNSGMGFIVTPGTPIGRRHGVVKAIEPRRVVVEEHMLDYYGREQLHEVVIEMPKDDEDAERQPGVTMMRVASGIGCGTSWDDGRLCGRRRSRAVRRGRPRWMNRRRVSGAVVGKEEVTNVGVARGRRPTRGRPAHSRAEDHRRQRPAGRLRQAEPPAARRVARPAQQPATGCSIELTGPMGREHRRRALRGRQPAHRAGAASAATRARSVSPSSSRATRRRPTRSTI